MQDGSAEQNILKFEPLPELPGIVGLAADGRESRAGGTSLNNGPSRCRIGASAWGGGHLVTNLVYGELGRHAAAVPELSHASDATAQPKRPPHLLQTVTPATAQPVHSQLPAPASITTVCILKSQGSFLI